jgi:hypothetical protein
MWPDHTATCWMVIFVFPQVRTRCYSAGRKTRSRCPGWRTEEPAGAAPPDLPRGRVLSSSLVSILPVLCQSPGVIHRLSGGKTVMVPSSGQFTAFARQHLPLIRDRRPAWIFASICLSFLRLFGFSDCRTSAKGYHHTVLITHNDIARGPPGRRRTLGRPIPGRLWAGWHASKGEDR